MAEIPWPQSEEGRYARDFLSPLLDEGVAAHLGNVETRLEVLCLDDLVLPLTINEAEYESSYVTSFYTHYVTYALEEMELVGGLPFEGVLRWVVRALGGVLRAGEINRAVVVNNWLLSTNLYPGIRGEQIATITAALLERFPHHAVAWRSIHPGLHGELAGHLGQAGYRLLASRRVYVVDLERDRPFQTTSYRRDLKLLRESSYEVVPGEELTASDAPRLVELYNHLYLEKYSHLNPQFSERFVRNALRTGALTFRCLRQDGRLDGVLGFFYRQGVMTTPFFGYDTSLPREVGLYRMLSAVLLHEARDRALVLHQSSGVGHFKRSRGAVGGLEFSAVRFRHLPFRRQVPWRFLGAVVNYLGAPLMNRLKL